MIDIDRTLRLLDVAAESDFVQAEAIDAINYLRAENARLRETLQPFADRYDDIKRSSQATLTNYDVAIVVKFDHLSAAAAAIREGDAG